MEFIEKRLDEAFEGSQIINQEMGKLLYCNIIKPDSDKLPLTKKVSYFNSAKLPSPKELIDAFAKIKSPSLFLFNHQGNVFGAYAGQSWSSQDEANLIGSDDCFLFNLNNDTRLVPIQGKGMSGGGKHMNVNQWKRYDGLGFGATDLILLQNGEWMSEILANYTPGHKIAESLSMEARKTFLAGSYRFFPTMMEVWILIQQ